MQEIPDLNFAAQVRALTPSAHRGRSEIRAATFGADACLMGAASLVLDAFLEDPFLMT
jgi:hypothetical protein